MDLPRVVAFDSDNTLSHNETLFLVTQGRFRALISRHVDISTHTLNARLLETERRYIPTYGYGIKGFVLSMIETAIEATEKRIAADNKHFDTKSVAGAVAGFSHRRISCAPISGWPSSGSMP